MLRKYFIRGEIACIFREHPEHVEAALKASLNILEFCMGRDDESVVHSASSLGFDVRFFYESSDLPPNRETKFVLNLTSRWSVQETDFVYVEISALLAEFVSSRTRWEWQPQEMLSGGFGRLIRL
jgi:hypothetical protein